LVLARQEAHNRDRAVGSEKKIKEVFASEPNLAIGEKCRGWIEGTGKKDLGEG